MRPVSLCEKLIYYGPHLEKKEEFRDIRLSKLVGKIFEESKKERTPSAHAICEKKSRLEMTDEEKKKDDGDNILKFYTTYEERLERIKNEVENDLAVIEYEYQNF